MIVYCHLLDDRSGSPTVLASTLEVMRASKNGLLFVGSGSNGGLAESGVRAHRFWYKRSRYRVMTLFAYVASQISLYRSLSRQNEITTDATIFVNTLLPIGAMLWGWRNGRRVIVHVHEISIAPALLRSLLVMCAAKFSSLLIYVSHEHKKRLPIVGPRSVVVPNPISAKITGRCKERIPRLGGKFRVLMLSTYRDYKGIEEFMLLAKSLEQRSDISFDLVLNAEDYEVADFLSHQPELINVSVHPRTDDPSRFYRNADLVLNLSRVDKCVETFGLTLVEAMSFGMPVIAPPIGGPIEIVTDGVDGYCIDSRDGSALRSAIVDFVDDAETYNRMSTEASKKATNFTLDIYAERMKNAIGVVFDDVV